MTSKRLLLSLVAVFALVFLLTSVSAFVSINELEVNGIETVGVGNEPIAIFAGDTVPVRVQFTATSDAEDVRVKAWISGERSLQVSTERFDVISGRTYSRTIQVQVPFDLDDELDDEFQLNVDIESRRDGVGDSRKVDLTIERESYVVELLDVEMESKVRAGEVLPVEVVIKNRGRQFSEDTFVKVSIPALGIEDRAYFGDLSPIDQSDPDKEDVNERRLFLNIPSSVPAGVYTVEVEAFNEDAITTLTRKIAIVGASEDTMVVAPVHSRTVDAGDEGEYSLTIVNTGNRVQVYELVVDAPAGLAVEVSDPILAVPAGTSKTVQLFASSDESGRYNFAVSVHSNSDLVKREAFTANVEGTTIAGNTAVLLTVVLAIVFVVLLVVLIVLLTRKTEKSEEFGESYY